MRARHDDGQSTLLHCPCSALPHLTLRSNLEAQLRGGLRPKLVYTIPSYQNPTSAILSDARRKHLVRRSLARVRVRAHAYGAVRCSAPLVVVRPPYPSLAPSLPSLGLRLLLLLLLLLLLVLPLRRSRSPPSSTF